MRPLIFDFPDDEEALKQDIEYMFGQSLLVCPVTDKGVSECKVYLPENEGGWYDFRTGEKYDGGGYANVPVTIEDIPVFAKGGSIVPMGPVKQHVEEESDEPVVLNIYPGADTAFCLYEDDGNSEAFSTIEITWDDAKRKLTIGKRNGSFEGMKAGRTFKAAVAGIERSIRYNGRKVTVEFQDQPSWSSTDF